MIKKYTMNKIVVTSLALILLLMFYFFPTNVEFNSEIHKENNDYLNEEIVYLLDEDNMVSKVISYFDKSDIKSIIKEKIKILTNGDKTNDKFYPLIPKNTILNSLEVKDDSVYLDFSKELLNTNKYLEESMIESIIYSLTEINGISNIYINVEGTILNELPKTKKKLTYPLRRDYGINKMYDITSLFNIEKTIIFFSKTVDDYEYYVPITKVSNSSANKIDIIIEELKSSVNAQDNLTSYVNSNIILEEFKIEDDKLNLVFNDYIFDSKSSNIILEEVKYVISTSVFENYDVNEVIFNTKDNKNIVIIKRKEN